MKQFRIFLFCLFLAGLGLAGEPIRQNCSVCHYDCKGDFTQITITPFAGTRFAYPFKNRCVLIDLWQVAAPSKIVIPLQKLAQESTETVSECNQMQIYAGTEKVGLKPVEGFKVSTLQGEIKGVPTETVTITGLPKARYFLLYAPRVKNSYAFGLINATKEVEVWADAPLTIDPALLAIPELDKIDPRWTDGALAVKGAGFIDLPNAEAAATTAYVGKGGFGRIGWPYKFRCVEYELQETSEVRKIVLTLEKMQMQRTEKTTGLEYGTVYVSQDGVSFKAVKPDDVKHETYRIGTRLYVRATLTGSFGGKYIRIFTAPKYNNYVFGPSNVFKAAVFFSGAKVTAVDFSVPFRVADELPFSFQLRGAEGSQGSVRLDVAGITVWSSSLDKLSCGKPLSFTAKIPKKVPSGHIECMLVVSNADVKTPTSLKALTINSNDAMLLALPDAPTGWIRRTRMDGPRAISFLTAAKGAKMQASFPNGGAYALYALQCGMGAIRFSTADFSADSKLELWHPADATAELTGENFIGIVNVQKGAHLDIEALSDNVWLGHIIAIPATERQVALAKLPKSIRKTAILHSDGYSGFFSADVTQQSLDELVKRIAASNAFAFDWCVGTTTVNYPSKISNGFGKQKNPNFYRNGDRLAAQRLENLLKSCDPIVYLKERANAYGIRFSVTLRANAFYKPINSSLNAQFFIDHPELLQREPNGKYRDYPAPSYAFKETRDFYLGILKEIAERHPDAIVIEFNRHPPFFGYDKPLIDEYTRRHGKCTPDDFLNEKWQAIAAETMTNFLREARKSIRAIDPKIQFEINCDWKDYYKHGIDLRTLLGEGIIDLLSPGINETGMNKYFDLAPFREMIKASPHPVLLFPRVEGTIFGGDPTPDEEKGLVKIERRSYSVNMFRALWMRFKADGADGLRPFNTGGAWLSATLADDSGNTVFMEFVEPLLDLRKNTKEVALP